MHGLWRSATEKSGCADFYPNPLLYAHHLFLNGKEIKDLVIPNTVTDIGRAAFAGCSGINSVTIPNNVTSIGERAFSGCSGLTTISIGNSVTSIGGSAFEGCTALSSIRIPNSVKEILSHTFEGCSDLTSVIIGNSVTSVGERAFNDCSSLASVKIGSGMKKIWRRAFDGCPALSSITIPANVTSIGGAAFYGSNLKEVISKVENPCKMEYFWGYAFNKETYNNAILYVPEGTIEMYKKAEGWRNFLYIREGLPSRLTDIECEGTSELMRYTLDGKVVKDSHKGVNIIQMKNGTTKKVLVK